MGKHSKSRIPPRAASTISALAGAAVLAVVAIDSIPAGGPVGQPDALRHLPTPQVTFSRTDSVQSRPAWRQPPRVLPPKPAPSSSAPGNPAPQPSFNQTAAQKAVSYAYAQIGCPYVWGGNGPCDQGYDCSGLMQQAWAYAGVNIPRTTWDQLGLPHVAESEMRPGDLLIVSGGGHVGMYVGNGWVIDAPHQGANVEKVSRDDFINWNGLVAVVRP